MSIAYTGNSSPRVNGDTTGVGIVATFGVAPTPGNSGLLLANNYDATAHQLTSVQSASGAWSMVIMVRLSTGGNGAVELWRKDNLTAADTAVTIKGQSTAEFAVVTEFSGLGPTEQSLSVINGTAGNPMVPPAVSPVNVGDLILSTFTYQFAEGSQTPVTGTLYPGIYDSTTSKWVGGVFAVAASKASQSLNVTGTVNYGPYSAFTVVIQPSGIALASPKFLVPHANGNKVHSAIF